MSTLLMNGRQQCSGRRKAGRRTAARKPLVMKPVVPLLTRLLVITVVGGVLALLLGLSLTTRPAPPIAAAAEAIAADPGRPVAELPRVVVSGKRWAVPVRAGAAPPGTTSKDL